MTSQEQARPALPASCFPVGFPPVDQGPQPSLCLWNPGSGQRLGLSRGGPGIQVQEGSQFCPCRASRPEGRGCLLCPQQEKKRGTVNVDRAPSLRGDTWRDGVGLQTSERGLGWQPLGAEKGASGPLDSVLSPR